jgi:hypothetical protein
MIEEKSIVLWRSYKIQDKWYEGTLVRTIIRKTTIEYHIQTDRPGIHANIIRYDDDVILKKK